MAFGQSQELRGQRPLLSVLSREAARAASLAVLAVSISACGSTDSGTGSENPTSGSLLPLQTGNSWTYRVSDNISAPTEKTTTVGDPTTVGGMGPNAQTMAYEVTTRKGSGMMDKTVSYQAPLASDPSIIARYRELSYGASTGMLELEEYWTPHRLHIDGTAAHTKTAAMFLDNYDEVKIPAGLAAMDPVHKSDRWEVVNGDETVEVAGKTYEHAIHFTKVSSSDNMKEYWYLRGVGKLKETGSQTEELTTYKVTDPNGDPL